VQQVVPTPGEQDLSRLEHVSTVRNLERAQGVLLDKQDRRPVAVDLFDGGEHHVHHLWREA
jgi:hypothetical protein